MKIIQRLKNIWRLGELEFFPNGTYQKVPEFNEIDKEFTIRRPKIGYDYGTEKPHSIIIKKKPEIDPLEKELEDKSNG